MDEKLNNDKSFEQKNHQTQKNNSDSSSASTASYREIRAKSENERKKKAKSNKSNVQSNQGNKRRPQQGKKPVQQNKPQQNHRKQSKPPVDGSKSRPKSGSQVKPKPKQSANNHRQSDNNPQKQRNSQNNPIIDNPQNESFLGSDESKNKVIQQNRPTEAQGQGQNNTKNSESRPRKKRKMKRSSKPFSAKKRRRKILAMYSSMVVVILMIAAVLCLTVFFKIDSITVEGDTRYSTEEIIDASGITIGTNLLLCNTEPGKEVITNKFPYIESVVIKKNPFNSITIYIEEAKPTTAIETNGKFYILSAKGKIIEILDNNKYNVPLIKGAELKKTELSAMIEYKLSSMNNIINEVTEALENNDIDKVRTINVTNPSNVKLNYDKRLTIILGIPESVEYKIKTAKVIIDDKLEKDSKGTIDVSMCAEGGKYSYYDPSGAPEN